MNKLVEFKRYGGKLVLNGILYFARTANEDIYFMHLVFGGSNK